MYKYDESMVINGNAEKWSRSEEVDQINKRLTINYPNGIVWVYIIKSYLSTRWIKSSGILCCSIEIIKNMTITYLVVSNELIVFERRGAFGVTLADPAEFELPPMVGAIDWAVPPIITPSIRNELWNTIILSYFCIKRFNYKSTSLFSNLFGFFHLFLIFIEKYNRINIFQYTITYMVICDHLHSLPNYTVLIYSYS